jgi:hypothetical protein
MVVVVELRQPPERRWQPCQIRLAAVTQRAIFPQYLLFEERRQHDRAGAGILHASKLVEVAVERIG